MPSHNPSSPDNSDLPQRHRISLEKLRKESAETNLWDLEDDESIPREKVRTEPRTNAGAHLTSKDESDPFAPPATQPPGAADTPEPLPEPKSPSRTRSYPSHAQPEGITRKKTVTDDLGDLDGWDDDDSNPHLATPAPQPAPNPPIPAPGPTIAPAPTPEHPPESIIPKKQPATPGKAENRRKTAFTRNEIIGLAAVLLLLFCGAGFFLINAFSGLPRMANPHEMPELPAQGAHLTLTAAASHWRAPITSGPNADTVQRGTELMPVLEISATGLNASIRVQFHNSLGEPVGDPITRPVKGDTKIIIPSTAGLDDINVHNAYRTSLIDPWTAEILEAPAGATAGNAFRSLISFPISGDKR